MNEQHGSTPKTRNLNLSLKAESFRGSIRKRKLKDELALIRSVRLSRIERETLEARLFPNPINYRNSPGKMITQTNFKQNAQFNTHQKQQNLYFTTNKKNEGNSNIIQIGEYCFSRTNVIGKGSYAKVYKGFHSKTPNIPVAIKEIFDEFSSKSFIDEIFITKSIKSENVVQVYDSHINSGDKKCFIFLEYCEGGTLEKLKGKNLTLDLIRKIFKQIMQGMKALYSHRIIHRDLKLDNILVKGEIIKISDFGFAKQLGNQSQVQSIKCGTPSTMAPEILFSGGNYSNYNNKCDIWSIGVILHELAYGSHPFAHDIRFLEKGKRVTVRKPIKDVEDFLDKSLVINPYKRMGWEKAFNHPLLSTINGKEKDSFKENTSNQIPQNSDSLNSPKSSSIETQNKFSTNFQPRNYSKGIPKICSIENKVQRPIRNIKGKRKILAIPFINLTLDYEDSIRILKIALVFIFVLMFFSVRRDNN